MASAGSSPGASSSNAPAPFSSSRGSTMLQYDYLIKLLLIGDSGVGKSSLLMKFAQDKFTPHMTQTVGVDFRFKMLDLGGQRVKLQIWDTAGQERFHTITQQYYRGAHGIVLVYDSTNEESFNNIRRWSAQIAASDAEGADCLLLGNKADCEEAHRQVDPGMGEALAKELGMPFLLTSAKSGLNVEEAFVGLADTARMRVQSRGSDKKEQAQTAAGIRMSQKAALLAEGQARRRHGKCCSSG